MSPQALKPSVPMAGEGPGARASSGSASLEGRSIDCFSLAIIQALAKSQMERRLRNRRKKLEPAGADRAGAGAAAGVGRSGRGRAEN